MIGIGWATLYNTMVESYQIKSNLNIQSRSQSQSQSHNIGE
jgi:hypothetical protein